MGRTKKAPVDRYKGTPVTILSTGTEFVIGEPFTPSWEDLRYAIHKLWAYEYLTPILEHSDVPAEMVLGGNREQVEYMVPVILQGINRYFDTDKVNTGDEARLLALASILAWYWHMVLRGPRPVYDPKRYKPKKIQWAIEFECPACHKIYNPPKRYVKAEARSKAWLRWLPRHFREYHKWEVK